MADIHIENVLATGVRGLDEILGGGFAEGRTFIIKGGAGTGKTTLALQFLLEGICNGEQCLYIGVGGAGDSICSVAASHGWFLDRRYLQFHEVTISQELVMAPQRRVFHSAEVDLGETIAGILAALDAVKPRRVVIDTLAELRLLCEDDNEYRRQVLALRNALGAGQRTVLITDYGGSGGEAIHLEALAHGSIVLESVPHLYGIERRRLRVVKYRARRVRIGCHDFSIRTGGIQVYPALVVGEHREEHPPELLSSGNPSLDSLLHGGLNRGTATALIGPSGCGKSSLGAQFVTAAAMAGKRAAVYLFDETAASYLERSEGLGFPLARLVDEGMVLLRQLDVAEISPGEFVQTLVTQVEQEGVSLVVIDSLNGYLNAMPNETLLLIQLHELCTYLNHKGVSTFITVVQHGLLGTAVEQTLDVSYLADNVLLLRFFEYRGEVRRAISVLKKRRGSHELTIREISFGKGGIAISEPLHRMQGVLTGLPHLEQ